MVQWVKPALGAPASHNKADLIPLSLLPIQLSAHTSGKAVDDYQVFGSQAPTRRPRSNFQLLGCGFSKLLENEPTDGGSVSPSLSLFQISK